MIGMFKERAEPGVCSIFGLDDLAAAASSIGAAVKSNPTQSLGAAGGLLGGIINNGAVQEAKNAADRASQNNGALFASNLNAARGLESPYITTGINATNQINALFGLPSTGITPQSALSQASPDYAGYVRNNNDLNTQFQAQTGYARGRTMDDYGRLMWTQFDNSGRKYTPFGASTNGWDPAKGQQSLDSYQPGPGGQDSTAAAQGAFQNYLDSTGHQFRLQTGTNAITSSAAAKGLLGSGATLKGLTQYGQNLGTQDFGNYLQGLQVQQGLGPGATTNLINVGTNTAGALAGNNDSQASTTANAALTGAANTNNILSNLTKSLATAAGQSSYSGSSGPDAMKTFAQYGNQPN